MAKLKFSDICNTAAAVRCKQAGQSDREIAQSAKKSPGTVKRWIAKAGYRQRGGKLRHVSEAAALVAKLLAS